MDRMSQWRFGWIVSFFVVGLTVVAGLSSACDDDEDGLHLIDGGTTPCTPFDSGACLHPWVETVGLRRLAQDAEFIYYSLADGTIAKASKVNNTAVQQLAAIPRAAKLYVGAGRIVVLAMADAGLANGEIISLDLSGGNQQQLVAGLAAQVSIALDGDLLYVSNPSLSQIQRLNLKSGVNEVLVEIADAQVVSVAASGGELYWHQSKADGTQQLMKFNPLSPLVPLVYAAEDPGEPIFDALHAYWMGDSGNLYRVPRAGGPVQSLAATMGLLPQPGPRALAIGGPHLYAVTFDQRLVRVSTAGDAPLQELLADARLLDTIVADTEHIYLGLSDQNIYRVGFGEQ